MVGLYGITSRSDITPCIEMDKTLVVHIIVMLYNDTHKNVLFIWQNLDVSFRKHDFELMNVCSDVKRFIAFSQQA